MKRSITKKEFESHVIKGILVTLVQFKTEWSGASQIVSSMYEVLGSAYKGIVNFYSVDTESEHALVQEYGITEIPTILFFKNGKIIDHAVGLLPKNILIHKIEKAIAFPEEL